MKNPKSKYLLDGGKSSSLIIGQHFPQILLNHLYYSIITRLKELTNVDLIIQRNDKEYVVVKDQKKKTTRRIKLQFL